MVWKQNVFVATLYPKKLSQTEKQNMSRGLIQKIRASKIQKREAKINTQENPSTHTVRTTLDLERKTKGITGNTLF